MNADTHSDEHFMKRALDLAARGQGRVEPNPMVGAVIVRENTIIAEGFHERFGEPHAEPNAIARAGAQCRGATLYVTLDPCTGPAKKTPPCCDAVIRAGFRRVVIGARDPTQQPAIPPLQAAGIAVAADVLEPDCRALIAPFLTLRLLARPYVIAKWAMTADGKIAAASGDSKWISSDPARRLVHSWRSRMDAVLIGSRTARADNPLLTSRIPGGRNPLRIILDSHADLPLDSRLVQTVSQAPLLVVSHESAPQANRERLKNAGCRVLALPGPHRLPDLTALLHALAKEQLTNLMIEGGAQILTAFFTEQLVDEVRIFIAPKLLGGASAPGPLAGNGMPSAAAAIHLHRPEWTPIGADILCTGATPTSIAARTTAPS